MEESGQSDWGDSCRTKTLATDLMQDFKRGLTKRRALEGDSLIRPSGVAMYSCRRVEGVSKDLSGTLSEGWLHRLITFMCAGKSFARKYAQAPDLRIASAKRNENSNKKRCRKPVEGVLGWAQGIRVVLTLAFP